MGEVDKLDFLNSHYRINAKTKQWPMRIISNFLDFALENLWIEYRDVHRTYGKPQKEILNLIGFRENTTEILMKSELSKKLLPVGHPRNDAVEIEPPEKK